MEGITLYHGSTKVVARPSLAQGRPRNDYGRGFYTTRVHDLACEWACQGGSDGLVNSYTLWPHNLVVLDLLDGTHTTLEWLALLLAHRQFDLRLPTAAVARDHIVRHFLPDITSVDVIIGYRADDSYFSYARAFVENALPLASLEEALRLGGLGEQTVLVSGLAFAQLAFNGSEPVPGASYYPRFIAREEKARSDWEALLASQHPRINDLFILDILREEMTPDDPRLRGYLSRRC